jgi:hypothetical protein
LDKKVLQKIIREYFTPFAKKYHFVFYKPTVLLRICEDTLHIINFDLPGGGLNCNVAIQPLYLPSDTIVLSFGNRLNHFKTKLSGIWGYSNDEKDIKIDLAQISELLEMNAIPWFDEVGRPEGIISFIESGLSEDNNTVIGFSPVSRSLYLGFSYLYINKIDLAEKTLSEVVDRYKEDKRTWVIHQNQMISNILVLTKNEPYKISEILNDYVRITKSNLKIKM